MSDQLEVWRQMVARAKRTTGTVHWTEFGKLLEAYEVERKRAGVGVEPVALLARPEMASCPACKGTLMSHMGDCPVNCGDPMDDGQGQGRCLTCTSYLEDHPGWIEPKQTAQGYPTSPVSWDAKAQADAVRLIEAARAEARLREDGERIVSLNMPSALLPIYPTPVEREATAQAEDQFVASEVLDALASLPVETLVRAVEGPVSPEVAAGREVAAIEAPRPMPSIMSPQHADKFKLPQRKREDRASAFNLYSRVQREKGITDVKVIAAQWHAMKKDQSEPMGEP